MQLHKYNMIAKGLYSSFSRNRKAAIPYSQSVNDGINVSIDNESQKSLCCYSHLSFTRKKISLVKLDVRFKLVNLIDNFGKFVLDSSCKKLKRLGFDSTLIDELINEVKGIRIKCFDYSGFV